MPGQFFDIFFLAMIALFIGFRLYSVLGRRTGHERSPEEQVRVPQPRPAKPLEDKPVPLGERAAGGSPLQRALMDIKLADRSFDEDRFMDGARAAHEMIVTAYAKGDRETLRDLCSPDVYREFEAAIRQREARNERMEFTFGGLKSARITEAELKGRTAEITVSFESEMLLAGYDPDGKLVEGEAGTLHPVTDRWTFARETHARDPNWLLVATQSG
jgi:predicted lipid-binding transport protein (Tim44 family)